MAEGRVKGRRRMRDKAKGHDNLSETRLLREKRRNEGFPCQNTVAMREVLQSLCCAQWKLALPKERLPHHDPVNCSHSGHDIKSSLSLMPLFQQPSLETGNTGGHKKKHIKESRPAVQVSLSVYRVRCPVLPRELWYLQWGQPKPEKIVSNYFTCSGHSRNTGDHTVQVCKGSRGGPGTNGKDRSPCCHHELLQA